MKYRKSSSVTVLTQPVQWCRPLHLLSRPDTPNTGQCFTLYPSSGSRYAFV